MSDEENCSKPHESKEGHEVRQNKIKFKTDENTADLSLSLLEDLEGQMKNKLKDQTLAMKTSRESELKNRFTESLVSSRHEHSSLRSTHDVSASHR